MSTDAILLLIGAASIWVMISFMIMNDGGAEIDVVIWWPLVAIKVAIKSLYRVLFTDWFLT